MTGRCLLPLESWRKEKRGRWFGAHDQRRSCAFVFYFLVCVCFRIGELTTLLELNPSPTLNSRFMSSAPRYSLFSRHIVVYPFGAFPLVHTFSAYDRRAGRLCRFASEFQRGPYLRAILYTLFHACQIGHDAA